MSTSARKSIDDLLAVMAALRTPGTGCPWDLEQTFKTIAPYTIEEAYEVADAIEKRDMGALKDELGDLLLQVVYHARMAEEEGAFAFADVVEAITAKMIRRHPHVFGTEAERAAGAAPGFWERIKAKEKAARTRRAGVSDDVPVALPALTRAVKLQDKAASVGFDWPSLAPVFDKLKEELAELEQAVAAGTPTPAACSAGPRQDRGGVRRSAVRGRQRRPPPEDRSRGGAALRQPEVHPPLRPHRGAAGRRRPRPRAIDARRDGPPVGPGQGRGAWCPFSRRRERLEPAPAKAGGEGGHSLCAAFVAAPHPGPLPTEEWGEGAPRARRA